MAKGTGLFPEGLQASDVPHVILLTVGRMTAQPSPHFCEFLHLFERCHDSTSSVLRVPSGLSWLRDRHTSHRDVHSTRSSKKHCKKNLHYGLLSGVDCYPGYCREDRCCRNMTRRSEQQSHENYSMVNYISFGAFITVRQSPASEIFWQGRGHHSIIYWYCGSGVKEIGVHQQRGFYPGLLHGGRYNSSPDRNFWNTM